MGTITIDLKYLNPRNTVDTVKTCAEKSANLTWRTIHFVKTMNLQQQRYLASYCLGFLLGSFLFFTWQSFQYTNQYSIQYNERAPAMRPSGGYYLGGNMDQVTQGLRPLNKTERRLQQLRKASDKPISYLHSGIPKIIHQTWENVNIPSQFGDWVSSWKTNHPDWHYLFWTASGSKAMIKKRFPEITKSYEKYPLSIQKNDARRYIILYQYGGVYADIDMESLQELDLLLKKYPCIVAQPPNMEKNESSSQEDLPYVLNSFMACRPKHKFFKIAIDMLTKYQELYPKDPLRSTGPYFLNEIMNIYLEIYNDTAEEKIFVAPSSWFEPPSSDKVAKIPSFSQMCEHKQLLLRDQKILCDEYESMALGQNKTAIDHAFNKHYFKQTFGAQMLARDTKSLYDILDEPTVI